jgi:hypothetical protein
MPKRNEWYYNGYIYGRKPALLLQATSASHKLQATSDKHLTNLDKGLYRMYESKRSR